jgi:hypothetical protein
VIQTSERIKKEKQISEMRLAKQDDHDDAEQTFQGRRRRRRVMTIVMAG